MDATVRVNEAAENKTVRTLSFEPVRTHKGNVTDLDVEALQKVV
jgi:hypothetical protein